jgi:hypothetical protein
VTVNGEFVPYANLRQGDIIGLGKTKLRFTFEISLDDTQAEDKKTADLENTGTPIPVDEIKNVSPIHAMEQKQIVMTKRLHFLLFVLFATIIAALLYWLVLLQQ